MNASEFFEQLEARIAKYDLLCHPFYEAWSAGELTRDDLRAYAQGYYHHVAAFPSYLAEFAIRLDECELRRAVLANMRDELGQEKNGSGRSHADIWRDFVEGMGASRDMRGHAPVPEIKQLISHFHSVASEGTPAEALAAFYAYESQVPAVAEEKERGLRAMYGADDKTCGYFTLHAAADIYHSRVWREQLVKQIEANPEVAEKAIAAAEGAAKALWHALDGIESSRMQQVA
jgi:pyrroloquinoline-quinone synthase